MQAHLSFYLSLSLFLSLSLSLSLSHTHTHTHPHTHAPSPTHTLTFTHTYTHTHTTQPDSVTWSLCGPHVSIGWVRRDLVLEEVKILSQLATRFTTYENCTADFFENFRSEQAEDACGGSVVSARDTTGHVIVCNGESEL